MLEIRFAVAPCSLGWLLIAVTENGVCSVALGDDETTLEDALKTEFLAAKIERDDPNLKLQIEAVLGVLRGREPLPILPMDVRSTAFQRRVWKELRAIERGKTLSYGELAAQMGVPKSARAVARACGANPLALVTPCHRVVGKNGELTGYRWGLERKKALLKMESE